MDCTLLVISNFDLTKFGCPYCGSLEGCVFIINGTCYIWSCESCIKDCVVVGKSITEVAQFTLRNTDVKDLIGNHPYQNVDCLINSFAFPRNRILTYELSSN